MRIRQVVHIVNDQATVEQKVTKCVNSHITYRDPGVGHFGLKNALIPVGHGSETCFIEILSPIKKGNNSTGGRYLERFGEGGYMLIFQVNNSNVVNQRIQNMGFSTIWKGGHNWPPKEGETGIRTTHYNPKDFGMIISIDEAIPKESWLWAGEEWMKRESVSNKENIIGVEIESNRPGELAGRWAHALGCRLISSENGSNFTLTMSGGSHICFVQHQLKDKNIKANLTGRITAINISSTSRPNTSTTISGIEFRFVPPVKNRQLSML